MTNHEAELESTQRQSVRGAVDTTEDDAALAPEALCVDDAGPPLSCDCIKPKDARVSLDYRVICSSSVLKVKKQFVRYAKLTSRWYDSPH